MPFQVPTVVMPHTFYDDRGKGGHAEMVALLSIAALIAFVIYLYPSTATNNGTLTSSYFHFSNYPSISSLSSPFFLVQAIPHTSASSSA